MKAPDWAAALKNFKSDIAQKKFRINEQFRNKMKSREGGSGESQIQRRTGSTSAKS